MAERVLEDVLAVSEVSVDLDLQVLILPRIDGTGSLSGSEYLALSNFVLRHAVVTALARVCTVVGVPAPVCQYRHAKYVFVGQSGSESTWPPGLRAIASQEGLISSSPTWLIALMSVQYEYFAHAGLEDLGSGHAWRIPIGDWWTLHLQVHDIELEVGSFSALKRLGLQLTRSSSKVGEHVAGALIVASLVAPPSPPTAVEMMYVCTVGVSIIGSLQTLEQEAMTELTMPKHANDEVQRRVWAARQMCLAASGANPGPPDGVAGKDTRAAEDRFSQKYRVAVNWDSPTFRRFVLQQAAQRMKRADPKPLRDAGS